MQSEYVVNIHFIMKQCTFYKGSTMATVDKD